MDLRDRILAGFAIEPGGCWTWGGFIRPDGYAQMKVRNRNTPVHRASYETFVGPIPQGLVLDHICRNRACVNPAHLEPVSQQENILRGIGNAAVNAAKDACGNGHALDAPNTYIRIKPNGHRERHCRTCRRARTAEWRARKRRDSTCLHITEAGTDG